MPADSAYLPKLHLHKYIRPATTAVILVSLAASLPTATRVIRRIYYVSMRTING